MKPLLISSIKPLQGGTCILLFLNVEGRISLHSNGFDNLIKPLEDVKTAIKLLWKNLSSKDQLDLLNELHNSDGAGNTIDIIRPVKPSHKDRVLKAMIEINRQTKSAHPDS